MKKGIGNCYLPFSPLRAALLWVAWQAAAQHQLIRQQIQPLNQLQKNTSAAAFKTALDSTAADGQSLSDWYSLRLSSTMHPDRATAGTEDALVKLFRRKLAVSNVQERPG